MVVGYPLFVGGCSLFVSRMCEQRATNSHKKGKPSEIIRKAFPFYNFPNWGANCSLGAAPLVGGRRKPDETVQGVGKSDGKRRVAVIPHVAGGIHYGKRLLQQAGRHDGAGIRSFQLFYYAQSVRCNHSVVLPDHKGYVCSRTRAPKSCPARNILFFITRTRT